MDGSRQKPERPPGKVPPSPAFLNDEEGRKLGLGPDKRITHSREPSLEKLQSRGPVPVFSTNRIHDGQLSRVGAGSATGQSSDSRSIAYGHHRQTSIVHGVQHSRNGSHASTGSNPLSPEIIAAAGASLALDRLDMASFGHAAGGGDADNSRPATAIADTQGQHSQLSHQRTRSKEAAAAASSTQGRVERAKSRRDHGPHRSQSSRHGEKELRTVGDYTYHVLFSFFITQAEEKLAQAGAPPFDTEPDIEQICGPDADPKFDQCLYDLAKVAAPNPRHLVDSIMLWRKGKSDAATDARLAAKPVGPWASLQRRNTEPLQDGSVENNNDLSHFAPPLGMSKQDYMVSTERQSVVSIYVLCRILYAMIGESTLASITPEMEDKLEGIIFAQLKIADTEQLMVSPLKLANWNMFTKVLGVMSQINFANVAERFIADLDRSLQEYATLKSPISATRDSTEGRIELVLGGMKHLQLRTSPPKRWEQSCNFIIALGKLFGRSHGSRAKSAFCQMIGELLLIVATRAKNEDFMQPKWSEVLNNISPRLAQMYVKPRYWNVAFPLTIIMLCVSPPESFAAQWLQMVYPLQTKVKDRASKPEVLQALARLTWTYLFRINDTLANMTRKIEEVLKLALPTGRRSVVSTDAATFEPVLQIVRAIGYRLPDYCFRTILSPLLNLNQFSSVKDVKIDGLDLDKLILGIRAFVTIMRDLERDKEGRPPFPDSFAISDLHSDFALFDGHQARPIRPDCLAESLHGCYKTICETINAIVAVCDQNAAGSAFPDERFTSPGPKTPMAETFSFRRDEQTTSHDSNQSFYELYRVAVDAVAWCCPRDMPLQKLIRTLCRGTAHSQQSVSQACKNSLRLIAEDGHAASAITVYSQIVFNFESTESGGDEGEMLGPLRVEGTMKFYLLLVRTWMHELAADKTSNQRQIGISQSRSDLQSTAINLETIEAHGLFCLCSQSWRVRQSALAILRLVTEIRSNLATSQDRSSETQQLIDLLEVDATTFVKPDADNLSVAERSRLQKDTENKEGRASLANICTSSSSYDASLWIRIFPQFSRRAHEKCLATVGITHNLVFSRILQMYKTITFLSEPSRGLLAGTDANSARLTDKPTNAQPETFIEQWKYLLIFACTTFATSSSSQDRAQSPHHQKMPSQGQTKGDMVSARTLFKYLNPLLSASSGPVREAVVLAMGSVSKDIYRTLLEELQGHVVRCNDEARARIHQRATSNPRRNRKMDVLRTEITHVYKMTSHFLQDAIVRQDDWILTNLCSYAKDMKLFLMDGEVQSDWEFQKLRRHYCGLIEELFIGISMTKEPLRWMPFESRKSAFALMEDWCGFSPNQAHLRHREDAMRNSVLDQHGIAERNTMTAAMEIENRNLRTAALSAMAALCGGPVSVVTESSVLLQFDVRRMLGWIEAIFLGGNDRAKAIGRRALKSLIEHNEDFPYLLDHAIAQCYLAEPTIATDSYFTVIVAVVEKHPDFKVLLWRALCLYLHMLGNERRDVRQHAIKVLRVLQQKQAPQQLEIFRHLAVGTSDQTQPIYKQAQTQISSLMARQLPQLAYHVISEGSSYFKEMPLTSQASLMLVLLPWIGIVELTMDQSGNPTASSYVLLADLLEITMRAGDIMQERVCALWQALANAPHPGNVRSAIDFIERLCLERRDLAIVQYAKQIIAYLAGSNSSSSSKVAEYLLLQLTPKAMIPSEKREEMLVPADTAQYPYCADLTEVLPMERAKQAALSPGKLSMILLVDLIAAPLSLQVEGVALLLQVIVLLWDHYTPLVQEQAQEMLIHLVQAVVTNHVNDQLSATTTSAAYKLVDLVQRKDDAVVWSYEDGNGKVDDHDLSVPPGMDVLTDLIATVFHEVHPDIKEHCSRLSLTWAVTCPVRHMACRSFQLYRCTLVTLDQVMLGDMLVRLQNTVADEDDEIQTFAMEILTTIKTTLAKLDTDTLLRFPQLFWTTCACLESINEREFVEALEMLNILMDKVDLHQASTRRALLDAKPERWAASFMGIQPLLYKGTRSSVSMDITLQTLDGLVELPSDALIGDDTRLFFAIIANLPGFVHQLSQPEPSSRIATSADCLLQAALAQGHSDTALVLNDYLAGQLTDGPEFLRKMLDALKTQYLPQLEFEMLTTLIGMLTNQEAWVKRSTLEILDVVIPSINMKQPAMRGHGSDLISPLLGLLRTEFATDALKVLDKMAFVSASSTDAAHLRLSVLHPINKAGRKPYERVQSLFGIPEESGWAIPLPVKKAELTRANVQAVCLDCQAAQGALANPTPTPEVEFHPDEFAYGYFPASERHNEMLSDDGRGDHMIGDLSSKLDSLDDFFDDDDEDTSQMAPSDGRSSKTITEYAPDTFEASHIYDEQVLPLLKLASSSTRDLAYQSGFAERPNAPREPMHPNMMNPGAFATAALARPDMSRSITSPAEPVPHHTLLSDLGSDDDQTDEVFSDGDDEAPRQAFGGGPSGGSFFLDKVVRPAAHNTRTRMRRLTGGRSREERPDFMSRQRSPDVPKVPYAFLGQGHGQGVQRDVKGDRSDTGRS